MPLQNGQIIQNRYRIIRPLGKGGMGSVYLAQDARLGGKYVAIKEFDPTALSPQDRQWAATAFTQEAHMLAQLRHPDLTAVTDYFSDQYFLYLVMDYVEGETLDQVWQKQPNRQFDPQQVVIWAKQLCSVLQYLHSQAQPVIFRDLKPSNIMVMSNGQLKLIDFGIARYFKSGQTSDTVALGTPGYAAPEQYGHEQVDARSDVYSLGAVLHQLLTGFEPPSAPFNLPPVRSLAPHVPEYVANAVKKALELDRNQRPASAQDFCKLLQPQSKNKGTPIWVWGIFAVLIMVIGGSLGIWWVNNDNENNPTPIPPTSVVEVITTATDTQEAPSPLPDEESTATDVSQIVTVTVPVTIEPTITDTAVVIETTAAPMCTPPACGANEIYFCEGDCPGGCGTTCATVTPPPIPLKESWELARSAGGYDVDVVRMGTGSQNIVLVGTVRGGESPNSEVLVSRLLSHFDDNTDLIPSHVSLYFVPTLNPDGKVAGSRFNDNGVDLNRNWDTPSWKSNTEQPGGTVQGSGGNQPFSEPETRALRDLLLQLLNEGDSVSVIAYHYHTGISGQGTVQPGYESYYSPVQPSDGMARRLSQAAGYSYLPYWDGSYIPTGELIQWNAIQGIAAVDVELPRGVSPDSRPTGQSRTVFEAALDGIEELFN